MKKYIKAFWAIALGVSLVSCDLDTSPSDSVDSKLVLTNVANADKVLNGTWGYMMETYYSYANPGWSSVLRASDAMGNDVAMQPGKYGFLAHYQFNAVNQNNSGTTRHVWSLAYKVIDNCNDIITKIDALPGDSVARKRIKAQAYALRGYMYLNVATFYAFNYQKDSLALVAPIYTEPTVPGTQPKAFSSVASVYNRALTDLNLAYSSIGNYSRTANAKHKIDKPVIAGILARTYLQMGEWGKAQQFAKLAGASYPYMSRLDYLSGFNSNTNVEWMWGHGQIPTQSDASYNFHYLDVSSSTSYYYSFMADPYFQELFDDNDVRSQLFEWDLKRFLGGLMYKKFKFRSDLTADLVLMRKAEMTLIEAEAYAEQNLLTNAITKLNELRMARGANTPTLTGLSKDALVEEILIERRKELFGEGFALSDILRRQKSVVRVGIPTGTKLLINGNPVIIKGDTVRVKGHTVLKFPVNTDSIPNDFVPNSKYYLFAIPEIETNNNPYAPK